MTWTTRRRSDIGPLAAIVAGEGPLVVLIHGVGLRAEAWGAQIDALSARFRVVAVDMPGHGESGMLPGMPSLADYADAVAETLDSPAVIIGHSMGAMIATDLAAGYPGMVRGLCAMNAIFQRDLDAREAVQGRAASLDCKTIADPSGPLDRWFGAQASPERDACQSWLRGVDPAAYRTAYGIFAAQDGPSPATLANLHCPALFLTGSAEPNSTPKMSQAMAAAAPQGHALIIQGAAHMMPMTHGAEVNAALTAFLDRII